jgi:hypothetical protein
VAGLIGPSIDFVDILNPATGERNGASTANPDGTSHVLFMTTIDPEWPTHPWWSSAPPPTATKCDFPRDRSYQQLHTVSATPIRGHDRMGIPAPAPRDDGQGSGALSGGRNQ